MTCPSARPQPGRASGALLAGLALVAGCGSEKAQSAAPLTATGGAMRLIAGLGQARVEGSSEAPSQLASEWWRFSILPPGGPHWQTGGLQAGPGIADLRVEDGLLKGRVTEEAAVLWWTRTPKEAAGDSMHALEVRMRCSAGSYAYFSLDGPGELDLEHPRRSWRDEVEYLRVPILTDGSLRTHSFRPRRALPSESVARMMICPSDEVGAEFEIASIRYVPRSAHLAEIPTGSTWQEIDGLGMESIVARAPQQLGFDVLLPEDAWLDLHLSALGAVPLRFRVEVELDGQREVALDEELMRTGRWKGAPTELRKWGGSRVTLWLVLESSHAGAMGVWGAPVVRARQPRLAEDPGTSPRGVVLILADTLRLDHLSLAGYARETTPALDVLAKRGALFTDCSVPATWTQPSAVSLITSLYPSSHDVIRMGNTIPESATTLAEVFRDAGFATVAHSAVRYTGRFTRFDQGFEMLHEAPTTPSSYPSKTAGVAVPLLLSWLERHKQDRFFAFLHVYDPHYPFQPRPPFDEHWADPGQAEKHLELTEVARAGIADEGMREVGLPTVDEFERAGVDAEDWLEYALGWYDGSILGMDREIARLMQGLKAMDLLDETLVVFTTDHGEEFFDHGRTWHGQGVYGELIRAPLILFGADLPRSGLQIEEAVSTIDVMPTLLELFNLPAPAPLQGISLVPLLEHAAARADGRDRGPIGGSDSSAPAWPERAVFSEKPSLPDAYATPPPRRAGMVAVQLGRWKLIHNEPRVDERPEWELFDRSIDPLDQKNLAEQHPEVVAELRQHLEAWREEVARTRLERGQESELDAETISNLREMGYAK